eukprot:scaffold33823_cov25-Attheya_sp.AAC.2
MAATTFGFTPPGTKECWDTVHAKKDHRKWIVSGSPGIGKSVTTIYYLRLLMQEKAPIIIYDMRKQEAQDRWYLFALHVDGYHCFTLQTSCHGFSVGFWMHNHDCTHIVDLNQKDANLSPIGARTVLVTAPDNNQIGDYKKEGVLYSWVPVPTKSMVRSIAYDIVERSSASSPTEIARKKLDIQKKMHQVGPILCRLLDKSEHETALAAIKNSFKEGACVDTTNAIMSPTLQDLSQGKKPHSYLLMITKREYLNQDFENKDMDEEDSGASQSSDDNVAQEDGFVVVPVCREAAALAFNDDMAQSAKHFLSRHFSHLRTLQDGAGFEDWIILAACQGILKGQAYPLQGQGPVADDAVPQDVVFGDEQEHKEGKMDTQIASISAWLQLGKDVLFLDKEMA